MADVLTSFSEFIRNLVDVPSQEPLENAPIHLDYSSTTIRPFVYHIYSNTAIDFEMTTRVCKELFELCDRFQALQIYDLTCRTMQLRLENSKTFKDLDVWEIFRLAALKDDVKLAKSAIAALDSAGLTQEVLFTNNAKSRARFEGLPVRYVHAILMGKCTRDYMYNTTSPDCDMEAVWRPLDSKTIARDFKLY